MSGAGWHEHAHVVELGGEELRFKVTLSSGWEMGRYPSGGAAYQAIVDSGVAQERTHIWELVDGRWVHEEDWGENEGWMEA